MSEQVSSILLHETIEDTISYVNKMKNSYKHNKNKKRKKTNSLNVAIDELLHMKEGERKAQLVRPIVPIREWLNNEYYCGSEVFNLYPFWKEHLIKIYESPVLINELILTRTGLARERPLLQTLCC